MPDEEDTQPLPEEAAAPAAVVSSRRRSRSRRKSDETAETSDLPTPQRPAWEPWAMAALVLLTCFLGGGRSIMAKGVAVTLLGVILMLAAPTLRAPASVLMAFAAVILAPLVAYLPAGVLELNSDWRTHLAEDWAISLPGMVTVQPWITLESWIMLAAGSVWVLWCVSRGTSEDDRRTVLRLLAVGFCVISVLTLLQHRQLIHISLWRFYRDVGVTFGPFANRNHTSSLLAIGAVLCAACALDAYRRKSRQWIFFFPAILPIFLCIIANTSRAGVLLFFLGLTVWLTTAAMKRGFFKKTAITVTLLIGGFSVMNILGGGVMQRLRPGADHPGGIADGGGRLELYMDSIYAVSQSPWAGFGLGNFADRYPMLSTLGQSRYRFLHPESDLLWLLTEGGLLLVVPVLMGVLFIFRQTGPWFSKSSRRSGDRQDRRLRNAAAIAAGLGLIHGLVDVPLHSAGYMLAIGMLAGLGIRQRRGTKPATFVDRSLFRLAGAALVIAGVCWLQIAAGKPVLPGTSSASLLSQQSLEFAEVERDAEALNAINHAIAMQPLNWSHYFIRAQTRLKLGQPHTLALEDFGRARTLEPNYALPCFEEGEIWRQYNPDLAIPAWREFLNRGPYRRDEHYEYMLQRTANIPGMDKKLRELAKGLSLKIIYLKNTKSKEEFQSTLQDILDSGSVIEGLTAEDRTNFFRLWQERGDRDQLKAYLEKTPLLQPDSWPILAEERARAGQFKEAYELAIKFIPLPTSPSVSGIHDITQLERNFLFNQTDPRRGVDLYFAQKGLNRLNDALSTLEKISRLPDAPKYIPYEMGTVYAQKQDYRTAWEMVSTYLKKL